MEAKDYSHSEAITAAESYLGAYLRSAIDALNPHLQDARYITPTSRGTQRHELKLILLELEAEHALYEALLSPLNFTPPHDIQ